MSVLFKQKSDVLTIFKEWKTMTEKETVKQLKSLRIDNGLEFCPNEYNIFFESEGISMHLIVGKIFNAHDSW